MFSAVFASVSYSEKKAFMQSQLSRQILVFKVSIKTSTSLSFAGLRDSHSGLYVVPVKLIEVTVSSISDSLLAVSKV